MFFKQWAEMPHPGAGEADSTVVLRREVEKYLKGNKLQDCGEKMREGKIAGMFQGMGQYKLNV